MTVLHLSHAADASDGGIAFAVTDLVAAQQAVGLPVSWLTADRFAPAQRDRQLLDALLSQRPELVHLHGLWRSPTRIAPDLAARDLPLVVAPHGMLDPWALAHSRWKKMPVMRLWEQRALQASRCLHALCPAEAEAIRQLGIQAPIALISNGVTLPDDTGFEAHPLPDPPWSGLIPEGDRVLLYFGRFHVKKGLQPLLSAWESLAAEAVRAGWWLVLVGYGDSSGLGRQASADPVPRCLVFGPAFDRQKQAVLAASSAFVLPSFSEGLPMAALEAMSHRLPCLLSAACNLPNAIAAGAALPAEPEPAALCAALRQLFELSSTELAAFGDAGRELVAQHYDPAGVARCTIELYDWIQGGGARPGFVEG